MSSLVDALLADPPADAPSPYGDVISPSDAPTPRSRQRQLQQRKQPPSSSRPGPSDGTSEGDVDMGVDPDDEVVGPRGTGNRAGRPRPDLAAIPKVTDEAGDQIMQAFVTFLEE